MPITVPPLPANIAFGPFNYEREPIQIVRCIPADLLHDKTMSLQHREMFISLQLTGGY